jgi:tetratricopeptide (TPR) repeat protein
MKAAEIALHLKRAETLFARRQLDEAGRVCRDLLDVAPAHPEVLHLSGAVLSELGQPQRAEELLLKASLLADSNPLIHYNLAGALAAQGRRREAIERLRWAVALRPLFPEAWNNLASLHLDLDDPDRAARSARVAVAIAPGFANATYNLSQAIRHNSSAEHVLRSLRRCTAAAPKFRDAHIRLIADLRTHGTSRGALTACRNATRQFPDDVQLRHETASLFGLTEQPNKGLPWARSAIVATPAAANYLATLGSLLADGGEFALARPWLDRAIAIDPTSAESRYDLANLFRVQRRMADAGREFRRATALHPLHVQAHNNLAYVLASSGDPRAQIARLSRALAIVPDDPDIVWNRALTQLLLGDYERGWHGYEVRWRTRKFPSPPRDFRQPRWAGTALQGHALLVHAEQGLGDTIQFARYLAAPPLTSGRVVLECQRSLVGLLSRSLKHIRVVSVGEPAPEADFEIPLLSLPYVLRTRVETIPDRTPYLTADVGLVDQWRHRLAVEGKMRVGLVWQGNPAQPSEPGRSLPLRALMPILTVPGCRFFLLQKEYGRDGIASLGHEIDYLDLGPELADFDATSAVLANLDVVISSCTSVAHLAGALGRRVWVLLRRMPDWRWLLYRDDSPWYPTARLFRQSVDGDWSDPVARAAEALHRLARP